MFERKFVHPFRPTAPAGAVTLTGMRMLPALIVALSSVALVAGQAWLVPLVMLLLGVLLGHGLGVERGREERVSQPSGSVGARP